MKKLSLLLLFVFLTSCASLDFQIRTLNTVGLYDGIYYNTTPRLNSNFVFFQPNFTNNLWWNYSLNYPYNWYGYNGLGLTYNWRYNRWSTNDFLFNPYQNQFRIQPIIPRRVIRNRGRRNTQPVNIRNPRPRTRISVPRNTPNRRVRTNSIRTPRVQVRQPQRVRTRTQVRRTQPPTRTQIRSSVRQTQSTRRSSVIKNKRNQ